MSTDIDHTPDPQDHVDNLDRVEVHIEHSPEQTLIAAELEHGSVVAAVDVGEIAVSDTVELGRDLRDLFDDVVSNGGDR
ncbi:hypothetical protein [Halorhabdus amylolytica]|uniref:hypothetical protein n=1 Tax=Halorhabdus amylolytica TaxID=2559573 RepID=UPI0010AA797B|nr:hypothetical protein [Halorhabdus amylolytica]